MYLSSILTLVLCELGLGTALFVCLQKTGEIRKSFFSFQSSLATAAFSIAWMTPAGRQDGFGPLLFAVISGLAASWFFSRDRNYCGKGLLLISGAFTAVFLEHQAEVLLSQMLTGSLSLAWPSTMTRLNMIAGTFLFGWANGTMILGHWYLIMRGLSFSHLQRATLQLLFAVGVRTLLFVTGWLWLHLLGIDISFGLRDPLLLFMRVIWGLLLPGVFGFMAWRCALTGSNQAATGLLYIAEVAVLIGEILAGYLGF